MWPCNKKQNKKGENAGSGRRMRLALSILAKNTGQSYEREREREGGREKERRREREGMREGRERQRGMERRGNGGGETDKRETGRKRPKWRLIDRKTQ